MQTHEVMSFTLPRKKGLYTSLCEFVMTDSGRLRSLVALELNIEHTGRGTLAEIYAAE